MTHANGGSRRSGERESVEGSPRGEAPRMTSEPEVHREVVRETAQVDLVAEEPFVDAARLPFGAMPAGFPADRPHVGHREADAAEKRAAEEQERRRLAREAAAPVAAPAP